MSRWWAERVRIGLAPDRVDLARVGLRVGRKPSRQRSVAYTAKAGGASWQSALDAIEPALAEFTSRGDSVTVVLSNHWVRYVVLPWQPEVTNATEVAQLARLRFEHTYGAAAAAWTIRTCDGGYGAAHVACAVDTALIAQLQSRLAARGLHLTSLQPLLMAAYNDVRREFEGSTAFAIVEPGRLCLSLLERGRWLDVTARRVGADPAEAIEQELATLGVDAIAPRVDVLLVGAVVPWSAPAERATRLLGPQDANGGRSLAMCGAA